MRVILEIVRCNIIMWPFVDARRNLAEILLNLCIE